MKLAIVVVIAMEAAPALAAPGDARCAKGIELATTDLPRAALYLEGCEGEAAERAHAAVTTKLRASELSEISIVSETSAVVAFESSAMPGEPLSTPATIWAKAGTYKIHVTSGAFDSEVTVKAYARATVVLRMPAPKATTVKDGAVTFLDEPTDPQLAAPPPAQKHPSLLPCKYDGCNTHGGEELVDPLAAPPERVRPYPPELRVGVRVGVVGSDHVAPSFALAAHWKLLALRLDGSGRGYRDDRYDDLGLTVGAARVIASPEAAWISLGVGVRGDLRVHAPMTTSRVGAGANAELELALRSLPVTLAARYEQGFAGEHAVIVEVGGDWRVFE